MGSARCGGLMLDLDAYQLAGRRLSVLGRAPACLRGSLARAARGGLRVRGVCVWLERTMRVPHLSGRGSVGLTRAVRAGVVVMHARAWCACNCPLGAAGLSRTHDELVRSLGTHRRLLAVGASWLVGGATPECRSGCEIWPVGRSLERVGAGPSSHHRRFAYRVDCSRLGARSVVDAPGSVRPWRLGSARGTSWGSVRGGADGHQRRAGSTAVGESLARLWWWAPCAGVC